MVNLAEELAKERQETKQIIRRENDQLRAKDRKLQHDNNQLRNEVAKLRHELRQAKSEMKTPTRQKDQNDTLEIQNVVKQSIRQKDVTSELKKLMNEQISKYLTDNKVCVKGTLGGGDGTNADHIITKGSTNQRYSVSFGKTFHRTPAFSVAFSKVEGKEAQPGSRILFWMNVEEVTKSSAVVVLATSANIEYINADWIACL